MAESFRSRITVDKTIVSLLSKFTYERSFPYAIREVVSNAYDADATEVKIEIDLSSETVTIHDNGTGMTRQEFDFYLRIAGQTRGKRQTPKFGRKRIGQFGVGFLAILPFCETLRIVSTTENSDEVISAKIPAKEFFRSSGKAIDVGEIEVIGEVSRSEKIIPQHFTQITLLKLTDLARRYLARKPAEGQKDRVASFKPIERLKWEMQEDLPLPFRKGDKLAPFVSYPEPIGMDVYFQGQKLYRNSVDDDVLDHGELTVEGVQGRYAISTPWKAVKPFELQGLKLRLNNVGVGSRQVFDLEHGRSYSRLHWLTGEVQILSGLDGAVTLSRDSFIATPEFEALSQKFTKVLRKWADHVEGVDVASRNMTKQIGGGKQVVVEAKRQAVNRNVKALESRGFSVRREKKRPQAFVAPVHVDKAKKEVVVYEEHPDLEDVITVNGKKRRILYIDSGEDVSYEDACRINSRGDIEVETQYALFKSRRYGDLFKRFYIIAAVARKESSTVKEMYKQILAQIDEEFADF